jgi:hypothetical protein
MRKEIINTLTFVMNSVTVQQLKPNSSDSTIKNDVLSSLRQAQEQLKSYISWDELTQKDCEEMRFGKWAKEEEILEDIKFLEKMYDDGNITKEQLEERKTRKMNTKDIMLIPVWMYPLIPIGYEVISIFGDKLINNGKNINSSSRYGCIAYGIVPKDKR